MVGFGLHGRPLTFRCMPMRQLPHQEKSTCEPGKTFGQKCSHVVKKQRAKFYILRRCIAMLVCWRDNNHDRTGS
ncbi:unnamed protein product [Eruca vesicaria subsp. sativa]|uniref:Uncharacterized protein n=1 Tax=Eruca vesicaria subsp. sativa TaxID=29727 RepID=A0ABC8KXM9_ERUVS|nr:unnamed protein product [Eruca vesicaria subsp. sativa]